MGFSPYGPSIEYAIVTGMGSLAQRRFKGGCRVYLDRNCPLICGVHTHGMIPNTKDSDVLVSY